MFSHRIKFPRIININITKNRLITILLLVMGSSSCQSERPPKNPHFIRPHVYIMLTDTFMAELDYYKEHSVLTEDIYIIRDAKGQSYDLLRTYNHSIEVDADKIFITLTPKNNDTNESYIGAAFITNYNDSTENIICYGYKKKLSQPKLIDGKPTCGKGTLNIRQGMFSN